MLFQDYGERHGMVNVIVSEKPLLKPDASPTIFENYPERLLPKKAQKRKVINISQESPAARRSMGNIEPLDCDLCSPVDNAEDESEADLRFSVCAKEALTCSKIAK